MRVRPFFWFFLAFSCIGVLIFPMSRDYNVHRYRERFGSQVPQPRAFVQNMQQRGKPATGILTAVMHILLHMGCLHSLGETT
jgi:hypothetical protein